jgi:hypothetical protein
MYFNNKEEVIEFLETEKKINPKTKRKIVTNGKIYLNIMQEINTYYPELFLDSNNSIPINMEKVIEKAKPLKYIDSDKIMTSNKVDGISNLYEYEDFIYQGPFTNKTRLRFLKTVSLKYTRYILSFEILKDKYKNYWIKMKKINGEISRIEDFMTNIDLLKELVILDYCNVNLTDKHIINGDQIYIINIFNTKEERNENIEKVCKQYQTEVLEEINELKCKYDEI